MKIDNVSRTNMRSLSCACQHSMSNKPAAICVNDLSKTSLISFFPSFQPVYRRQHVFCQKVVCAVRRNRGHGAKEFVHPFPNRSSDETEWSMREKEARKT